MAGGGRPAPILVKRPKSALRRRVEQSIIYHITAAAAWGLTRLPMRWLRGLAGGLGSLIYVGFRSRQRLADANLAACFGDRFSAEERRRIRLFCVRNVVKTMLELLKRRHMTRERIMADVTVVGAEHLREALGRGRGVIVATPHYGNWEMLAAVTCFLGCELAVVARDANDPRTADIINRAREAPGNRVFGRDDLREMIRWLREGHVLGILPDQHQAVGGATLTFLGRPAQTALGPALLSLRTGAALVPAFARRLSDDSTEVKYCEALEPPEEADRQAAAVAFMQQLNDAMGEEIAAHPEQWLWLHNRWKIRPPEGEARQAKGEAKPEEPSEATPGG